LYFVPVPTVTRKLSVSLCVFDAPLQLPKKMISYEVSIGLILPVIVTVGSLNLSDCISANMFGLLYHTAWLSLIFSSLV
jgi:hypothetical protein